ncbi:hypothetical protein [Arthrobacter sp. StoSoilB5]|uniref:hypothetical protein n=1 Tax=Arthrobacter sp. StoSoilB5 TaxID=2830992 RepID=UPI001CC7D786|nr:hypothetical protein [Arthrobacter sp. StoSoilB5]BCW43150.1 hypothetical protein StoSoilB5_03340 [Arthrobacter sp. StoSoilB5]
MNSLNQVSAILAAMPLADAPDIHLLFMAVLVFFAGIVGVGSVLLLLLLAPLIRLALGRHLPHARPGVAPSEPTKPDTT